MPDSVPDLLDFFKQVERHRRYQGVVPVSRLQRLVGSLSDDSGEVQADVGFGVRAGIPSLAGTVSAELQLQCQRCLEPLAYTVEGSFRFGLIASEEDIDTLPAEFEPLLVAEGEQSLYDVMEDELILSLPLVCRHEHECSEVLLGQGKEQGEEDTYKPFAGLRDLMTQD